jgi:Rod binding domain-containing protein
MIAPPPAPIPPSPTAPRASAGAPPATLRRLATEFEAQAIAAMFQPVFAAIPTDGPFGGGAAEGQWRPMLVDAMAREMARAGGIGLGQAVFRELLRAQEGERG